MDPATLVVVQIASKHLFELFIVSLPLLNAITPNAALVPVSWANRLFHHFHHRDFQVFDSLEELLHPRWTYPRLNCCFRRSWLVVFHSAPWYCHGGGIRTQEEKKRRPRTEQEDKKVDCPETRSRRCRRLTLNQNDLTMTRFWLI